MKEVRELAIWTSGGRVFQAKEKANARAIRWTLAFTFEELQGYHAVGTERNDEK